MKTQCTGVPGVFLTKRMNEMKAIQFILLFLLGVFFQCHVTFMFPSPPFAKIVSRRGFAQETKAMTLKMSSPFQNGNSDASRGVVGSIWQQSEDIKSRPVNMKYVSGPDSVNETTQITTKDYPFKDLGLPLLKTHTKFPSGSYGKLFWHQDEDFVYIFYKLDEGTKWRDVNVEFDVQRISIFIHGELRLKFQCFEKMTPSTIWSVERDSEGRPYIFIDLEKRHRYIGWDGLFEKIPLTPEEEREETKKIALHRLFHANQGLAKLAGGNSRPATVEEMMHDQKLMASIAEDNVDTTPRQLKKDDVRNIPGDIRKQILEQQPQLGVAKPTATATATTTPLSLEEEEYDEGGNHYQYDPEEIR
jgi:hypothetical protein